MQIDALQKQIQNNTRPINSLSRLLRQVYFNTPTQLNAAQILPIIIEQKTQTAYFFHFKDNHIYNFSYSNTFIGEIVDFACILELAAAEDANESETSTQRSQQVTDRDFCEINQQESVYNQIPSHRKRSINCGRIRSVTNENYKHILYYPVVGGPLKKTKAVIEVCFSSLKQVPKNVLTTQIQIFLESFSSQLNQLEQKLRIFCKFTESAIAKRDALRIQKYFQQWRSNIIIENQQEQHETNHKQVMQQNEHCFHEYIKSLECYDSELKKLVDLKEETDKQLLEVRQDRTSKYKFLGAALILIQSMQRRYSKQKLRALFARWKYNQNVSKIAEAAFNKLLELNHRHSLRRFSSACFLLHKSVSKITKRDAIETIAKFAHVNQLRQHRKKQYGSPFQVSELSQSNSKYQTGEEKFSNVLGPGIILKTNYHSAFNPSQMLSSNIDKTSNFGTNQLGSAVPFSQKSNQISVQLTQSFTPNKTGRTYDSKMEQFGVQMGFGAVPNHKENVKVRKRSTSRSTSQKRFVNK